jgi:excinuclease UvrABC ATPase subunit
MSKCTNCDGSGTIKEYDDYDSIIYTPVSVCNGPERSATSLDHRGWLDEITEWTEEMFAVIRRKLNIGTIHR